MMSIIIIIVDEHRKKGMVFMTKDEIDRIIAETMVRKQDQSKEDLSIIEKEMERQLKMIKIVNKLDDEYFNIMDKYISRMNSIFKSTKKVEILKSIGQEAVDQFASASKEWTNATMFFKVVHKEAFDSLNKAGRGLPVDSLDNKIEATNNAFIRIWKDYSSLNELDKLVKERIHNVPKKKWIIFLGILNATIMIEE